MPEIISNYIELHICHQTDAGRRYLLLKRSGKNRIYPNLWQMITGGVEVDESTAAAVKRELFEETGITKARIYVVPRVNTFYLAAIDKVCLSPVFLAMVNTGDVTISDEHSEYKWVTVDEARSLVHWPNQIESMELIEKNLSDTNLFTKLVEIKI
jgi:dATP pyrophosphohydrolase